ncbi:hypothetical protein RRG08_013130 [Elysia crispata]|uniref:Uncharacterized protein n=1 Tax=Elysia crispata TaxID=231223 RepID=A0AAE1A1E0_9GAST|nr:hypothetical protein RRG08_013130 [Elysia crispata]
MCPYRFVERPLMVKLSESGSSCFQPKYRAEAQQVAVGVALRFRFRYLKVSSATIRTCSCLGTRSSPVANAKIWKADCRKTRHNYVPITHGAFQLPLLDTTLRFHLSATGGRWCETGGPVREFRR